MAHHQARTNTQTKNPIQHDDLELLTVDYVSSNVKSSQFGAMLYIFEDNEAVIKMIIKGISPTMRHASRTHRVALRSLFDRIKSNTVTPASADRSEGFPSVFLNSPLSLFSRGLPKTSLFPTEIFILRHEKKEERADRNRSPSTKARRNFFVISLCVETPHSVVDTKHQLADIVISHVMS